MKKNLDKIIVSSRVRLARNLCDIKFKPSEPEIFLPIAKTIQDKNQGYQIYSISSLDTRISQALFEQHLVSHNLLENKLNGMIVTDESEKETTREAGRRVCVMLGEEDSIRIQCIDVGLSLNQAYKVAKKIAQDSDC